MVIYTSYRNGFSGTIKWMTQWEGGGAPTPGTPYDPLIEGAVVLQ